MEKNSLSHYTTTKYCLMVCLRHALNLHQYFVYLSTQSKQYCTFREFTLTQEMETWPQKLRFYYCGILKAFIMLSLL